MSGEREPPPAFVRRPGPERAGAFAQPADRLIDAVRVAAAGDALLAPSITRRLIASFTSAAPAEAVPATLSALTAHVLSKLGLRDRVQAVVVACQSGLA